jgi:hypothetical protein
MTNTSILGSRTVKRLKLLSSMSLKLSIFHDITVLK